MELESYLSLTQDLKEKKLGSRGEHRERVKTPGNHGRENDDPKGPWKRRGRGRKEEQDA